MTGFSLARLDPLFHTPLLTFRLPEADRLNPQLLAAIAALRAAEPGLARSNRGGWHSHDDLFDRPEPAFRELCAHLVEATHAATRQTARDASPEALRLACEGWINVNPPGAFNAPHDHPGWYWSGCYYVTVPAAPADADPSAGCLELIDLRTNLRVMSVANAPHMTSKVMVRPEAGVLLLFPSHVQHWVYPAAGPGDRVSIAFNARYERA